MIAQAVEALRRSARDPGYLLYFLRNVNVLRDHFPRAYRWWREERKALRLGGPSLGFHGVAGWERWWGRRSRSD